MNGVHDMGGMHGFGPVIAEADEPVHHHAWEGRVGGMMRLCLAAGLFNLDEFRRSIEAMPAAEYLQASYYERWLGAVESLVAEKAASGPSGRNPRERPVLEARWQPGDRVRTRNLNPPTHIRLPRYAREKTGVVVSVHGPYLLPDRNAHGPEHVWQPVYTVRFSAEELWGEGAGGRDAVALDLWEAYLEDE